MSERYINWVSGHLTRAGDSGSRRIGYRPRGYQAGGRVEIDTEPLQYAQNVNAARLGMARAAIQGRVNDDKLTADTGSAK